MLDVHQYVNLKTSSLNRRRDPTRVNVLCSDQNLDWDAVIKLLLFRYSYNHSNIMQLFKYLCNCRNNRYCSTVANIVFFTLLENFFYSSFHSSLMGHL